MRRPSRTFAGCNVGYDGSACLLARMLAVATVLTACQVDLDDIPVIKRNGVTGRDAGVDAGPDAASADSGPSGPCPELFVDADRDGHGRADMAVESCAADAGLAAQAGDCNDGDEDVHPGVTDACNGIDDDCNGESDTGCSCDGDESIPCGARDGSGKLLTEGLCEPGEQACKDDALGACTGAVMPVDEICDGTDDEDCDGHVDEGVQKDCWPDLDDDGYAAMDASAVSACVTSCPEGQTDVAPAAAAVDCDDADEDRAPGASDICNDLDDDCDGTTDEDVPNYTTKGNACGTNTGVCNAGTLQCNAGNSALFCQGQITATNADANCNNLDDDCDTKTDESYAISCANPTQQTLCVNGTPTNTTCTSGACLTGMCVDCTPGRYRCTSRTQSQRCDGTGHWNNDDTCTVSGPAELCDTTSPVNVAPYGTCVNNEPYFVGLGAAGSTPHDLVNNQILAQPIDVTANVTLLAFGIRTAPSSGSASARAYLSLHNDNNGQPGTMVNRSVQLDPVANASGNLTGRAFSTPAQINLVQGTRYWIVAKLTEPAAADVKVYIGGASSAGDFRSATQTYAVPGDLAAGATGTNTGQITLYIQVQK